MRHMAYHSRPPLAGRIEEWNAYVAWMERAADLIAEGNRWWIDDKRHADRMETKMFKCEIIDDEVKLIPAVTAKVTPPAATFQHERVRALIWCPRCFGHKGQDMLVCWPCNQRLKRAYSGGHGPMDRVYDRLDAYLATHTPLEALSYLGAE